MTRIATFNVNGVNGRLPVLFKWLGETDCDVVCLQELKTSNAKFRSSDSGPRLWRNLARPEIL